MRNKDYYINLWKKLILLDEKMDRVIRDANIILSGKNNYMLIEKETKVPWYVVGILHCMEASDGDVQGGEVNINKTSAVQDYWMRSLHNGKYWSKVNDIIPSGARGPFNSWNEAAIDALKNMMCDLLKNINTWDIFNISMFYEKWNSGIAYERIGVNSPYLYAGSNYGIGVGKFQRGKGYVKNAINNQAGSIAILKYLFINKHIDITDSGFKKL